MKTHSKGLDRGGSGKAFFNRHEGYQRMPT
jgi:hypothetical protein